MPVISGARALTAGGVGLGQSKWAIGLYDFATDGGAVSAITLRGGVIPSGAIIVDSFVQISTILASGGSATVALGTEAATDLLAATAFGSAPWATTGAKRLTLTATAAPVVTTAARSITATIATAALTAGRFKVGVRYIELSTAEV